MACKQTASGVPGSVYNLYSCSEVVRMLEEDEPMMEGSGDDLDLDIQSEDEL